jgi:diaminopimelate decarboxylase
MPNRNAAGQLSLGGVTLEDLARDPRIGTPAYVYDLDAIAREARDLQAAFEGAPHLVAYAVKANTAGSIVRAIAGEGCGADVVSGAELAVALGCGIPPDSIVYSGVAKTDEELDAAIGCGPEGIAAVQAESLEELARIAARARALGRRARVSLRVNPEVDRDAIDTHAHIATGHDEAKFGLPREQLPDALALFAKETALSFVGVAVHVGSQLTSTEGYVAAARTLFQLARELRPEHPSIRYVDTGGGFGIDYGTGCPVCPADFVRAARAEQRAAGLEDLALFVEPGRSLVAAHGVLLATVIQTKVTRARRWLLIDAGMNDLIRPALYQAVHRVVPLGPESGATASWRVVGPVCESSDDFGHHRLPERAPERVAILDAGAYGFTMASRYNGRPAPAEVFLSGGKIASIEPRGAASDWVRDRLST